MSDVFVSYSRDDREYVTRIVAALEAAGENVWVDLEDIAPSALWMDEIKTAIAAADSMVFFLSPDSVASAVCREELDHAVELSKRIVPVLIRDVSGVDVPAPLPDINWDFVRPETFDHDVAQLVEVLNTDIARVHQHTRLLVRANEWQSRDGDASLLLHGSQLAEAEKWLEGQTDQKPTTTPLQARFIAASRRAAVRKQRRWSIAAVAIATVFAVIAGFAIIQWRNASRERHIATEERNAAVSRQLAVESQNALRADPQLALILAVRAYDASPTSAAQDAVRSAVRQSAVVAILPGEMMPKGALGYVEVGSRAFNRSGDEVVLATDRNVAVWNWSKSTVDSPRSPVTLDVPADLGDVMGAEFRDDSHIVFATRSGAVYEWDWTTGATADTMRRLAQVDRNPYLGPSGKLVATVDDFAATVTRLDGPPAPPITFDVGKRVDSVGVSQDGTLLATNSAGSVDVWSLVTGVRVTSFSLGQFDGDHPTFSPDNRRLAVGSAGAVKVVDVAKPADVTTLALDLPPGLPAHCCDVNMPTALAWSPDGTALAAATSDTTVRVWVGDVTTPVYLNGDTQSLGGVSFSPDGAHVLSGGSHPEVWEWAAAAPLTYPGDLFTPPVFSPDGQTVALADGDENALILGTQRWSKRRLAHGIPLAYSPDGRRLAVEEPGAVAVWDVESTTRLRVLPVSNPGFGATTRPGFVAEFDPSGTVVALLDSTERPAKLSRWQWDSTDPAQQASGSYGSDGVAFVGWSGAAIHFIVRDRLEAWDGNGAPRLVADLPTHTGDIDQAAYLSPTNILLTFGEATLLWDLSAKTVTDLLSKEVQASQFALSGDKTMVAVSGNNGFVNVWDRHAEDPALEIGRYSVAPYIALNGDGSRLAVADTSAVAVIPTRFAAQLPVVVKLARRLVARQLTAKEKAKYLPE